VINPRNFRIDPTLPVIVETDARKKAIGVALIQEVQFGEEIDRRLIYAASIDVECEPGETNIFPD